MNERANISFPLCGTMATVTVWGLADDGATRALAAARRACERYEALLTRFRADSDIGRLNAARGERVPISSETFEVLSCAMRFCDLSDGVFDITTAPLSALWDFEHMLIPDAERLEEAARHVGWRRLALGHDATGSWACLADARAAVDVGGMAKGWMADRVGELLAHRGAVASIVDIGGDIRVCGCKPEGEPWRIGVRDPQDHGRNAFVLAMDEGGIVTSGTYERSFVHDGTLYHHVLDPRTGMPALCRYASVTVVADDAASAEGASSAALVLGPTFARSVLQRVPEVRAFHFIDAEGARESIVS